MSFFTVNDNILQKYIVIFENCITVRKISQEEKLYRLFMLSELLMSKSGNTVCSFLQEQKHFVQPSTERQN